MASFYRFLRKHKRSLLLYGVALIIRLAFAIPFVHDWDGFVFSESAKNLLRGETPYQTVIKNEPSIYPDSDKPMIQQWYAYPPLPLLMFTTPLAVARLTGLPLTELTETLLLKLLFIFGDLLAAWLVKKLLENKHGKMAKRAELLVLFNPLLIWVSSAWGMFDIWMANFLFLFLLALRKQHVKRAGVYLALACTTKLFPVFFLPVIAVYVFNTVANKAQGRQLVASFVITLTLIVAPFFLTSPRGFLNQNLLMHLQRPSQGLSITAIYDHYADIYQLPAFPVAGILTLVMYATMAVAFLHATVAIQQMEEKLIWSMVVIYISMLVFNKVTNEQYFVLLIVLLIVLLPSIRRISTTISKQLLYSAKITATYGVLTAAALLGFHFLGFLLPGLTQDRLRSSTNNLVFYLSRHFKFPLYTYPDSAWTYYNLPMTIASLAMVPFTVTGLMIVWTEWRQAWSVHRQITHQLKGVGKRALNVLGGASWKIRITVVLLALTGFSSVPSTRAYIDKNRLFTPVSLLEDKNIRPLPEHPRVGTFYNVWWNNFSHYKDFPYGDWNKTTQTPLAGYYTSKNSYFVEHIQQMKRAGIDFAIVSYHLYDRKRYLTFGEYAEKLGLYYAPLIESYDVLAFDKFRPEGPTGKKILGFSVSEDSRKTLSNVIVSSLANNLDSPALLRIQGKPVIFVYDGHWYYPSWDDDFKQRLADRILERYSDKTPDVFLFLSDRWDTYIASTEDVVDKYPVAIDRFNDDNPMANDFQTAFLEEYESFWQILRKEVEDKIGPAFLVTTYTPLNPFQNKLAVIQPEYFLKMNIFDSEFFYSIANTWVGWQGKVEPSKIKEVWEQQIKLQTERMSRKEQQLFLTVTATYSDKQARPDRWFEIPDNIDGVETYNWAWETALQHNPDFILVTSWNEFFEGTAIEPSKEYGDYYIGKTAEWSQKLRGQFRY